MKQGSYLERQNRSDKSAQYILLVTAVFGGYQLTGKVNSCIIPSLTVRKLKNRCIPCTYWVTAIFVVVAKYSNLFFPFTFFLNCPHLTFSYELIVRSEATDLMKIIRDSFPFV